MIMTDAELTQEQRKRLEVLAADERQVLFVAEEEAIRAMLAAYDALRLAAAAELRQALQLFVSYGCPLCNGDCASANPPPMNCPMHIASAALAQEPTREGG
jgi:hypothetical protein